MFLVPRWDSVCTDSHWVFQVLAWSSEVLDGDRRESGRKVLKVQINRKADMMEVLRVDKLSPERTRLVSVEDGSTVVVIAQSDDDNGRKSLHTDGTEERPGGTTAVKPHLSLPAPEIRQTMVLRPSDVHLAKDCAAAWCFRMMDFVNVDRAEAKSVLIWYDAGAVAGLRANSSIEVTFDRKLSKQFVYSMVDATSQELIAQCTITFADGAPLHSRYDRARHNKSNLTYERYSLTLMDSMDEPVITSFLAHSFETSCMSALAQGLIHWADLGASISWNHVLPPSCPLYREMAPEDGRKKYIPMYRATAAHIFAWPRRGASVHCTTWVANTGKSTFALRCDFRDFDGSPIATVQFTMVIVDRIKMRPAFVFHDKAWAEARYRSAIQTGLPAELSPPHLLSAALSSSTTFEYPLVVRHYDQDQNGHVNSAKYMQLVQDARTAALLAGFFPLAVQTLVEREGWMRRFSLDYLGELMMEDECVRIVVTYAASSDGHLAVVLFNFIKGVERTTCTKVWVETVQDFDPYATRSKEPGPFSGCKPEHWGFFNVGASAL